MDKKESPGYESAVLASGKWVLDALADYLYDYFGSKERSNSHSMTLDQAIIGTLEERGFDLDLRLTLRTMLVEYLIRNPEKAIKLCDAYHLENDLLRLVEAGIPRIAWGSDDDEPASKGQTFSSMWTIGICETEREGRPYRFVRMTETYGGKETKVDLHLSSCSEEMSIVFATEPQEDKEGHQMALVNIPLMVFSCALEILKDEQEKQES